jgi:hypothetical protein
VCVCVCVCVCIYKDARKGGAAGPQPPKPPKLKFSKHIQGDSRLVDFTVGGDFLSLCDQKSSYKHVSDFGRLRSYDRLNLRIKDNDY